MVFYALMTSARCLRHTIQCIFVALLSSGDEIDCGQFSCKWSYTGNGLQQFPLVVVSCGRGFYNLLQNACWHYLLVCTFGNWALTFIFSSCMIVNHCTCTTHRWKFVKRHIRESFHFSVTSASSTRHDFAVKKDYSSWFRLLKVLKIKRTPLAVDGIQPYTSQPSLTVRALYPVFIEYHFELHPLAYCYIDVYNHPWNWSRSLTRH